mmetsp:Transcript_46972/g.96046  ORF Transcript_46972/g.96046 Transcript_46972/m.96046 type:complete len:539 (+) Transcript_46972:59-1675(+)
MFILIDANGNIGISEESIQENFSAIKMKKETPIKFFSHIGTYDYGKNSLLESLVKNKNSTAPPCIQSLQTEIIGFEVGVKDICLTFNSLNYSLDCFKKIKFLYSLSEMFFFHINLNDVGSFDKEMIHIVQFLFTLAIENWINKEVVKTDLHFVVHDNYSEKKIEEIKDAIEKSIQKVWEISLNYMGEQQKTTSLEFDDLFSLDCSFVSYKDFEKSQFSNDIEIFKNKMEKKSPKNDDKENMRMIPSDSHNLKMYIEQSWEKGGKFLYIPLLNKEDRGIKNLINLYQTDVVFNQLWEISNNVIKNWTKMANRGKIIDNFGTIVSEFLNGLLLQFGKSLPLDFADDERAVKKIQELSNMVRNHIISLFTRQVLNLQTQALDKFKDALLTIISDSKKDFEFEKKVVMEKTNLWFEEKAGKIVVPEMQLTYQGAKKELQNVLIEFAEKFRESPVVKLNSMEKVEKKTSNSGLKQSGIVIGFGLTTAVRPSGFGNFQLVTSYSHGPHVFNFSLVNDRDVAEQEGQGKIKPIRIQPSLNFDIDL